MQQIIIVATPYQAGTVALQNNTEDAYTRIDCGGMSVCLGDSKRQGENACQVLTPQEAFPSQNDMACCKVMFAFNARAVQCGTPAHHRNQGITVHVEGLKGRRGKNTAK